MKNYKERVGDRWQDPEDLEIVEIQKVENGRHWIETINKSMDNTHSFTMNNGPYTNDIDSWRGWQYLGNFAKSSNTQSLYNKLQNA